LANRLALKIDEEKTINEFAGAFLVPKEIVIQEIGQSRTAIEMRELLLLKELYGISMNSQCYRLLYLGVISTNYFNELKTIFKKKGWDKNEPGNPYPSERIHIFEHLVLHAFSEGVIGLSKAAELLNMTVERFNDY